MILILKSIVGVSQQPLNALAQLYSILQEEIYTSKSYRVHWVIESKLLNSTNSTNSYYEEACISEGFYLKGKTLKAETLKTNFTGEVGQQPLHPVYLWGVNCRVDIANKRGGKEGK